MLETEAPLKAGLIRDIPVETLCQRLWKRSCEVSLTMRAMISADDCCSDARHCFEAHPDVQLLPPEGTEGCLKAYHCLCRQAAVSY